MTLAKDSPKYAKRQFDILNSKTKLLKSNPRIGKMVEEFQNKDVLELIEGNYRIIYQIISKTEIHILMIHHGARKLPRIKK